MENSFEIGSEKIAKMSNRKRTRSPLNREENDDDDFDFDENCSMISKNLPVQRNAANARERARMRVLSSAFCRLKTKLPWVPADTKLSKLDTLRLATIYIQQLRSCLARDDAINHETFPSVDALPMITTNQPSLVWPFTFSQNISDSAAHRTSTNLNQWLARDSLNTNLQDFDSIPSTVIPSSSNMHYESNHSIRNRIFGNNNNNNNNNNNSMMNHSTAHG